MYKGSSDYTESVLDNENDVSLFDGDTLDDEEILQEFPSLNEEQIDKLKIQLLVITRILYEKFKEN